MQNRIKELRQERGMNQNELALKMNVSQQTISRIENGETSLPADLLVDLSKYFSVSVDYILYLTEYRRMPEQQIEFNRIQERNYEFCRIYEKLSERNQKLI